ncbi:MAG: nucleotide disphospho-sugar-binding domain-containing protein [Actinomycetota bacterium]
MSSTKTIVFFPEGAFGPTNNCVGIGEQLQARGHRVVFIIEESFEGTLAARGFAEALMRLGPKPQEEEVPGQFWKDFIRDNAPIFRKSTIEQLGEFIQPTWQALLDGSRYVQPRLLEILDEVRPDVVVEDNVPCFPAVVTAGVPWVRMVSCNPLELKDPDLPPVFAGYAATDRSGWDAFRSEYRRTHHEMWSDFNEWVQQEGAPALEPLEFIHRSPYLNMYLYPQEADYPRSRPLDATWQRLDSCVRGGDPTFELPAQLRDGDGALIYLSMGSLASADLGLMERLVGILGRLPHRFIVSKGPQHDRYELADNMWGAEFLPQPSILPMVDLVITHGGNNTTAECFHHGKPMIVLPVFWDQHDNAQRVHETGFGVRLDTYGFEAEQMRSAIDGLLADGATHERMATIARRLQANPGAVRAADLIERL